VILFTSGKWALSLAFRSRGDVETSRPRTQWVPREGEVARQKADHSPPPISEIRNVQKLYLQYTIRLHFVLRDNLFQGGPNQKSLCNAF